MRTKVLLKLSIEMDEVGEIHKLSCDMNTSINELSYAFSLLLKEDSVFRKSILIASRTLADSANDKEIEEILNSLNIKRE